MFLNNVSSIDLKKRGKSAVISSATLHAMPPELSGKWIPKISHLILGFQVQIKNNEIINELYIHTPYFFFTF